MNYSEPLIKQIIVFFRAIGCGIIIGIVYEAVTALRILFGEKTRVYYFFDILFSLLASVISFFFMVLYNSGQVRLNVILAEVFGAVAFHLSLGRYMEEYLSRLIIFLKGLIRKTLYPFEILINKLVLFVKKIIASLPKEGKENKKKDNFSKKLSYISKIHLKNKNKSV